MQKVVSAARRLPIGAEVLGDETVHFRVWAPRRRRVALVLHRADAKPNDGQRIELAAEEGGYFSLAAGATAGMLYGYRLDHQPRVFPDPA